MNDNTTGRIKQLERRCDELLESEAYAAGVIELVRGMVDGEAFDVCEEFTEQRHSSVAPIVTVRRERDEARAALDDVAADPGHKAAKYWKWWQREKARADRAERARDEARAEASKIEGRAVEWSKRAETAEAALERVKGTFFKNHLYLTMMSHPALNNEGGEILYDKIAKLIQDTIGRTND